MENLQVSDSGMYFLGLSFILLLGFVIVVCFDGKDTRLEFLKMGLFGSMFLFFLLGLII